jgi:hypothetical protein
MMLKTLIVELDKVFMITRVQQIQYRIELKILLTKCFKLILAKEQQLIKF